MRLPKRLRCRLQTKRSGGGWCNWASDVAASIPYDWLEQFVGAAIRSADHILPEPQQLAVGDTVRLLPVVQSAARTWRCIARAVSCGASAWA
jgi:hypothetical protein